MMGVKVFTFTYLFLLEFISEISGFIIPTNNDNNSRKLRQFSFDNGNDILDMSEFLALFSSSRPSDAEKKYDRAKAEASIPNDDDDINIFKSLEKRKKELTEGIGKRYVTRTQRGFLNVHSEPTDPFDTSNIVGQLVDGDIVVSTTKNGPWIQHSGGGWSISIYEGFTWLQPIEE